MTGHIYAIECAGHVKLGYSENPERRLNKIAADTPFPCDLLGYWPGTKADELDIHQKFQSTRARGEWFVATEELLSFVSQHVVPAHRGRRFAVLDTDSPLAAWRKRAGMKQQELAGLLCVNTSFISMLEAGETGASLDTATKISKLSEGAVPFDSLVKRQVTR
ncbi:Meiotically Up-regulated Gene 113 (MUG113) protein [Mesorhizobium loti]|uniref:Meiotically Up-regulated Gene 113 (MUG113) protein n=1 Tax=Rhizobium loti TaxID=381 RepID=A0A8E3B6P7_RHILI|nr:GIY-YIG nuclease family protein [Mesorhizobium loti]PWJ93574.1 Meiotically Up-regulated Gene 113 (MUG113) protein [Mesorhizobium loti]